MCRSTVYLQKYSVKKVLTAVALTAVFIAVVLSFCRGAAERRQYIEAEHDFFPIARKYAEMYGIDVSLVLAVMECESGFDQYAVSDSGACGLMQIMPRTFIWMSMDEPECDDIFDPDSNIKIGCKYLAYLFGRFGSELTVLAAYNAGEGNVSKWLKDTRFSGDGATLRAIPFPETSEYVSKVMRAKNVYM